MNDSKSASDEAQTGRYGAGYGDKKPPATPQAPPPLETADDAPAGLEPVNEALDPDAKPESEKVGLIFERS